MDEVQFKSDQKGGGSFRIMKGEEQIAEMAVGINGTVLTVYHTEVLEKAEGKGFAKKLLTAMADHARSKELKVIPLCSYVHLQFKRHPDQYADIWVRDQDDNKG